MARTTIRTEDITASEVTTAKMAVDPTNASNLSSGSVPTAQLGNVDTAGLEDDIALLGFKVASNGSLAKYNLVDQTIDDFQDDSGVDDSASTGENRDSTGKYYSGVVPGNYFGDGSLGTCTFGASSITQTGDTTAIDTVLSTGSESGGPGSSSYGDSVPNSSACYEATVLNTSGSYDGDMVLMQFDTLTIDASVTLTTKQPCRGLFIYVKNNCVINGSLSMTSRGGFSNPTTSGGSDSNAVGTNGLELSLLTSGGSSSFTNDGTGFNGAGSAIRTAIANQDNTASNGTTFTISKLGGAAIDKSGASSCSPTNGTAGNNGVTGASTISTGGGGTGGSYRDDCGSTGYGGGGGAAGAFSGGAGGGASARSAGDGSNVGVDFGGGGGTAQGFNSGSGSSNGSGNPGGSNTSYSGAVGKNGVGGIIWLIVGGTLTIGSGATVEANGVTGGAGAGSGASGGATGGGAVMALHSGALTNNGSINVNGGAAETTGAADGGAGGTGGKHTATVGVPASETNMTLVSNATTAESTPTKGDLVMTYTNGVGTATLNTDLKGYVSRDNGTTYTQGTLASQGTTGGHTIVTFHDLDISSQPSGTAMRYKIETLNQSASKATRIQAVSLGWS